MKHDQKLSGVFHKRELVTILQRFRWIDYAMILFFASRFFTSVATSIVGRRGIFVIMGIMAILYFGALIQAINKKEKDTLFSFFFIFFMIVFLALWTMTFNKEAMEWMLDFNYGLFTKLFDVRKSVFALFVVLLVRDPKCILRNLKISAWFMTMYLGFQTLLFFYLGSWEAYYVLEDARSASLSYNLSYGYEMVFVSMVFLTSAFFEKKKKYYYVGLGTFLLAFLLGSRGVMLPMATFILLIVLLKYQEGSLYVSKKYRKIFLISSLGIASIVLSIMLLNALYGDGFQLQTGIRNIDMLFSKDFVSDNGRTKIWALTWQGIKEKFPLGYGVFGDRPFVGRRFIWGYAHNYFLETTISFGVFGILLNAFLFYTLGKSILFSTNKKYVPLLVIFTAMNSKLMISDSFWFYDYYWALLGILLVEHFDVHKKPAKLVATRKKVVLKNILVFLLLFSFTLGNVHLAMNVVKDEVKLKRYRTITFTEPTVVVAIESPTIREHTLASYVLQHREIPYSVFLDVDTIEEPLLDSVQSQTLADVHIAFGSRTLEHSDEEAILNYAEEGKTITKELFGQRFTAGHTLSLEMYPGILQSLRKEVDAFFLREARHNDPHYYTVLRNQDFYKLRSLNGSINDWNYRRINVVRRQIEEAAEKNAFMVIYFSGMGLFKDELMEDAYSTKISYFTQIIELLQEQGFQFVTITDVLTEAKIDEEDRTLKNFIIESDFYQKLRSTNE